MSAPESHVGQRSETVRRANLSAIARELHLRGPQSRSELGLRTGLTRSAIRGLIGELSAAGLVDEARSSSAGLPGRPSPIVRPDPRAAVVLALEINVDSLAAALVGFGGTVHDLRRADRPRGHLSSEAIVGDLVELVTPMLAAHGSRRILAIGVGVAGVVRRSDGLVRHAPNLGWRDVPLGEALSRALGLDLPLSVANEADLGGLAEHRRGAAIGASAVIYVAGEVGVGGNLLVDGQPVVGAAGYAGEIGHMPVNPEGAACGCGSIGCWETEIGERAMLLRAGRPAGGGREAVASLIDAAQSGDPAATAAMEHTGTWLGIGLAGLVNIFNPGLIVLGGLLGRVHPLIAEQVEAVLDRRALSASRELVRVVPAALGVDGAVLGAAELAFEGFLADPTARLRGAPAVGSAPADDTPKSAITTVGSRPESALVARRGGA
ncbi:MAG TPA: ROK family protein [Candidatus Limnocylindria bacterium]|nr:ROK family protein [Candidatus Limnocylindria bacterium]